MKALDRVPLWLVVAGWVLLIGVGMPWALDREHDAHPDHVAQVKR